MKTISLLFIFLNVATCYGQFVVGTEGMTIQSGAIFAADGLSIEPTSNLTITSNSLQKSSSAVAGSSKPTISRVYSFQSPINFSGKMSVHFLTSELNTNVESALQIAHSTGTTFTLTTGSTVDETEHIVSNTFTLSNLLKISASSPGGALPVTLIDFTAKPEGFTALLIWSTSAEINADHFEIEHGVDAKNWKTVGSTKAAGESVIQHFYDFTHSNVNDGQNYYRLKMVDRDGTFAYSTIRNLDFSLSESLIVFPNPVNVLLHLKDKSKSDIVGIRIYNASGKLLYEGKKLPANGLEISHFGPGSYVLEAKRSIGKNSFVPFIKQ